MKINRRALLGAVSVGAAGATTIVAQAQTTSPPAPAQPSIQERIAARALENRHRLVYQGGRFSGPAYDMLVREGREATFFLIGEEHGIAENPKLAAQLFGDLRSSGYSKVAIETSPPMAAALDRAARDGADGLRSFFADPGSMAAFFTMREEAEWLAAARAAVPGRGQMFWGLDCPRPPPDAPRR